MATSRASAGGLPSWVTWQWRPTSTGGSAPESPIEEKDSDGLQRAFGYVGQLDFAKAADDATAALEHLRGLPEVAGGKAGILGFCLGGGIAYMVAALSDPVTCISYYGSAVPDALGLARQVRCPILFHFGDADDTSRQKSRRRSGRLSRITRELSSMCTKGLATLSTITTRR